MFGKGRNQRNKGQQRGMGATNFGICSCPQCNYTAIHKRGVPCSTLVCPKCGIILRKQTQSENRSTQQIATKENKISNFPTVNTELCIGCGACIDICPSEAIHLEDGKAKITTTNCKNCKVCVKACPVEAIS